jgi:hypothetical protein
MSSIQSLLESANPWRNLQSDAGRLAQKWAKTGLLEGLGETDRNNMALMLENQAKQLVTENSTTSTSGNNFTVGQGENWAGIALPLVRKVFGQIAAKEFVSVQPMNLPSGLVFFLDFQYGTTKAPFAANGSMYGTAGTTYPFATPAPAGGLYGAGRFSFSINTSGSSANATTGSTNWGTFNFDSDYSASFGQYVTATVSLPTSVDFEAVRSFVPYSASVALTYLPAFTSVNGTSVTFLVTSSQVTVAAPAIFVSYSLATSDNKRGDFENGNTQLDGNNNPISIPEINVKMQSQAIVAKTRKLKAVWTPEYAQDLSAYQNIDAEAELTNIMSEYISMEIDLEILDMLIQDAAAGTEYWSAINNTTITGASATPTANLGFYNTQGGWFQTLGTKVQKLSNKIHQLTLRGGANFLVCSPTVATIFESIPGFTSNNNGDAAQMQYAFGVQKAGSLNGRYNIYKNPYMTENTILLGFRGSQFLEAGAVFAPYVPLVMTPLVYDPDTFTPRKGLLTRYAKKMLRPEFYGKIYVSGLNTI